VVALFGSGLVGGAIRDALRLDGLAILADIAVPWADARQRALSLARAAATHLALAGGHPLAVIWAAGRTGFNSGEAEAAAEREAFTGICEWVRDIAQQRRTASTSFHVVSSAGGLFEGQRFVDAQTLPRPLRPYGALKLEQEQIARRICDGLPVAVYRPSSVYGHAGPKGRSGLVTTLAMNAKTGTQSRIFGSLDTVRDYVLAADIGHFIAGQALRPGQKTLTFLLASGRPATLGEVVAMIRRLVGRPLYLKLDPVPSNAGHITYRSSALPEHWRPTDLETGVRQVLRHLSQAYEAADRG
jgi:UDP-glucose 4-epimerase